VSSPTTHVDAVRLVALREEPLDVAEVSGAVSDAAAGGIAIFDGTVRDHDHGHDVTGLEYSAHPTALARLEEVAAEVAADFDAVAVAAVHRVGSLDVGDVAVVCAVSGAHRGTAFDASRALIDRLKQRVPIWKHQLFADGTDEWVDTP
jgi:molybdopterin synthase catalytic subunit